ncbi:putative O-methyltransferase [Xylariaceae sp. FL0804]|nr:putative O-methyltransferase [Xylariaceae sp. FL0804]
MSQSRISHLSARIAANTARVDEYLVAHDLPQPSFALGGPSSSLIPSTEPEIAQARKNVIDDCRELRELMLGPREHLTSYRHNELVSQQAIMRFRLAETFPVGGETTFAEMAAASGLAEWHVRKLLRFAMAQHIFCEPRPSVVAHTAASRLLVEDQGLYNWLRFSTDDLWHAAYHTGNAMARWPGSEEPNQTGYSLANDTDLDMFRFFTQNPERERRFAAAMRFFTERPGLEPRHVVEGYPWDQIPEDGTVVDVGGSHGIVCIELARRFSQLRFVVQDLDEKVVREAEAQRPSDVSERVRYMAHDFFKPQPVRGADVYFLRAVLHNWSDTYAVKILQSLVPALRPGAMIVLNEPVIPTPENMPPAMAGQIRGDDLIMLELLNGGNREMDEWKILFAKAHSSFRFKGGRQPPGSGMWILEAEWMGP